MLGDNRFHLVIEDLLDFLEAPGGERLPRLHSLSNEMLLHDEREVPRELSRTCPI